MSNENKIIHFGVWSVFHGQGTHGMNFFSENSNASLSLELVQAEDCYKVRGTIGWKYTSSHNADWQSFFEQQEYSGVGSLNSSDGSWRIELSSVAAGDATHGGHKCAGRAASFPAAYLFRLAPTTSKVELHGGGEGKFFELSLLSPSEGASLPYDPLFSSKYIQLLDRRVLVAQSSGLLVKTGGKPDSSYTFVGAPQTQQLSLTGKPISFNAWEDPSPPWLIVSPFLN